MRETDHLAFLSGGGQMGGLMRAHDWSTSSLGAPANWPQTLRTVVRIMLNTGHPMYVFWGPELACLYNDAYSESIGPERHPVSLGRPGRDVWAEIWDIIGPQIDQVMAGGGATWHVDHLVPITRYGRREDVYWTYSYSPIDDETAPAGVGGVLVVCTETTAQVLTARRLSQSEAELREADRRKDEFIAMLAHELRNPLAPIRTGLELIRLAGDAREAVERVRQSMERQVGHMVRLVDDLLEISRMSADKIQLQRRPARLDEMVTSAVDSHRAALADKRIDLRIDLPATRVVVDVDPMAMLIESLGGQSAVAYDGESGLREALAQHADVVLLDIGMHPIDGYETCRRIRQAMGDGVKVVAVTGWGQIQDREKAAAAGFDAHLTKPADPEALRQLCAAGVPRLSERESA